MDGWAGLQGRLDRQVLVISCAALVGRLSLENRVSNADQRPSRFQYSPMKGLMGGKDPKFQQRS